MNKVVLIIRSVLEQEALCCASQVMSREFRMLAVCLVCEEQRIEL